MGSTGPKSLSVSKPKSSARTARLFLEELVEFLVLDREALGIAFLVGGAGLRGGLFGDLADVVAHDRDPIGKVSDRQ